MFGSSLAHGDHGSQFLKLATWANTAAGDAARVAERTIVKALGRVAT